MKIIRKTEYNGSVTAFEMGYGLIGRPFMTVFFYAVHGILVDTAQSNMRADVLKIASQLPIHTIILTHYHEDHSGNAAALKQKLQVPVLGHRETARKMEKRFSILPYQHLIWGAAAIVTVNEYPPLIETEQIQLQPVFTPGHSTDHTAYWEKNHGWLFSGDLFLAERIKYFRSDEKITDQIESLKKVLELDFDTIFCAHHPQITRGKQKMRNKLQFLQDFRGDVVRFAQQGRTESDIECSLELKETYLVKYMTCGNVSFRNMIRSALE